MRVLIVDDSRSTRSIVRRLLEKSNVPSGDIFDAGNGVEALSILRNHGPFDLATVDWNMPEMNGLEFVQAVRSNEANDAMKIIMVTTEGERDQVLRAVQAGAQDYVIKPFNRETLGKKLEALGLMGPGETDPKDEAEPEDPAAESNSDSSETPETPAAEEEPEAASA